MPTTLIDCVKGEIFPNTGLSIPGASSLRCVTVKNPFAPIIVKGAPAHLRLEHRLLSIAVSLHLSGHSLPGNLLRRPFAHFVLHAIVPFRKIRLLRKCEESLQRFLRFRFPKSPLITREKGKAIAQSSTSRTENRCREQQKSQHSPGVFSHMPSPLSDIRPAVRTAAQS